VRPVDLGFDDKSLQVNTSYIKLLQVTTSYYKLLQAHLLEVRLFATLCHVTDRQSTKWDQLRFLQYNTIADAFVDSARVFKGVYTGH